MTPPPAHLGPHYDSVPALPPDEAERWVKLAHRGLWAAWVLAVLWVVVYAAIFVFAAEGDVCTEADPCDYGWPDLPVFTGGFAAVLLAPIAVVRFPAIGLAAGLAAGLGGAVVATTDPDLASYPSSAILLAVTVIVGTCSVSVMRILSRREQRTIVDRHSVTVPGLHLPERDQTDSGWVLVVGGCALLAVGLTSYTAYRDHQWDQHADHAQVVRGTVTEHGSDDYLITVDIGDDAVTIDTLDASMYPVGSEVTVLTDGDWSALAADPYDPTMVGILLGPLLLVAGLAAFGGLRVRRSIARLREPHLALRVDVAAVGDDVLISAYQELRPLGRLRVVRRPAHRLDTADDPEDWGEHETDALEEWEADEELSADYQSEWDEAGWRDAYAALRTPEPAVLHGNLAIDAAPALIAYPHDAEPVVLWPGGLMSVTMEPPRRAQSAAVESWSAGLPAAPHSRTSTELSLRQPTSFSIPAWLTAVIATVLLALTAVGSWVVTDPSMNLLELSAITFGELVLASGAFRVATWRAKFDTHGIVARVGLTQLRISWDEIRGLPSDTPGLVVTRDDDVAMLLPASGSIARVVTVGASARLVQSIAAIHRDPSLRPTTRAEDPRPLIPELIVGLAGIPVAVNLVAWFLTH